MLTLLALRLALGWHFFQEGADKLQNGWSSAGFFGNAKGPLADAYGRLVWDSDGRWRLNRQTTLETWDRYRALAAEHFGFDDGQKKQAAEVLKLHEQQLAWVLDSNADEIQKYFRNLERRERQLAEPAIREVASLREQGQSLEGDLKKARGPWLASIDKIWASYERQMQEVATEAQRASGPLALERPGRTPLNSQFIDKFIPYFDLTVGICLLLGLFTRVAATAAGLFLAGVISSQWPGSEGAVPTFYQTVEMFALFAIAATGAGRFAGLDYIVEALRRQWFSSSMAPQESQA